MSDEEIEKAMLYYLIYEQEEYVLDENDFAFERNKKIITAINKLKAEKCEISILSIQSKIRANSKQVIDYITSLGEHVYTSSAESIYNSLISLSKRRRLLKIAQEIMIDTANIEDIDVFIQDEIRKMNKVSEMNEKEQTFLQQVIEVSSEIEKSTLEEPDYSLYTGITDLDKMMCGLHKQELTIIGARPRSRKNNTCITDSRIYSPKRSRNSNNKLRNVRFSSYTKNAK